MSSGSKSSNHSSAPKALSVYSILYGRTSPSSYLPSPKSAKHYESTLLGSSIGQMFSYGKSTRKRYVSRHWYVVLSGCFDDGSCHFCMTHLCVLRSCSVNNETDNITWHRLTQRIRLLFLSNRPSTAQRNMDLAARSCLAYPGNIRTCSPILGI